MMAYVDTNGNITSVPQDLSNRKKVSAQDILISTPKQEEIEIEIIRKGTVTFFNDAKGYGFIKDQDSQESIFVHINSLTEAIKEHNKVTFELEMGPKGANAVNVKLIG